jgi:uncharacterized membrane protein
LFVSIDYAFRFREAVCARVVPCTGLPDAPLLIRQYILTGVPRKQRKMAMTRRTGIEAFLVVLISANAAACGAGAAGLAENRSPVCAAPASLTEAALRNASYQGILEGPVVLSGGRFEGEPFAPGSATRPVVTLVPGVMATGDVDGDASDDAVVALARDAGGSGVFMYLAIVREGCGNPDNFATIGLGDRARISALAIDDGVLVADLVMHGPDDAMCCPTQAVRRQWRFAAGEPVPLGTVDGQQAARYRGHLVWGHESRSFSECDGGREGWVINESGDELVAVYEELATTPYQPVFVEVRGEWLEAPAEGFGAGFGAALRITELLRAENEGFGCGLDLGAVQYLARGNEPFWSLRIRDDGMSMRLPGDPEDIVFPAPEIEAQPGLVTYESENAHSGIRVMLERRRCVDTMSGARYAWTARVDIGSMRLSGCAAEGI